MVTLCLTDWLWKIRWPIRRWLGLYARYRAGYIARQDGAREKRQIEKAWENAKARIRYSKYSGQFFKTVEWYATDYRKRRTIEAADKLVDAVDGFLKGVPGSGSTDLHK